MQNDVQDAGGHTCVNNGAANNAGAWVVVHGCGSGNSEMLSCMLSINSSNTSCGMCFGLLMYAIGAVMCLCRAHTMQLLRLVQSCGLLLMLNAVKSASVVGWVSLLITQQILWHTCCGSSRSYGFLGCIRLSIQIGLLA